MELNYSAGNQDFRAVIPFSKVERMADGRLMIEGIATSEAVDHDNEIIDYESAKAAFALWSGNIREQHDPKKAVGKALSVIADDVTKKITVRAFISNGAKDTQEKCLDGTLSCYSIGGSVSKREAEKLKKGDGTEQDVHRVYVKGLSETSVVDKGSNPDTSFALVKSVGDHLEGVGLETVEPKADPADTAKADDKKTTEADPLVVKGKDEDVLAFGKALNDSGLTMLEAIDAIALFVAKRDEKPDEMLVALTAALRAGEITKRLNDPELSIVELVKIASEQLTEEERKSLKTPDDVRKAITEKMSQAHKDKAQAIHDHASDMGAACSSGKAIAGDVSKLEKTIADLTKEVETIKNMPKPHVVHLRMVSKEQSNGSAQPSDWLTQQPFSKLVKNGDGSINWEQSNAVLKEPGAAA